MKLTKIFNVWDYHTAGCPVRIVTGGIPFLKGDTILEKMNYMAEHYDWMRTSVMLEPRGHREMVGAVLMAPTLPEADVGVFYVENAKFETMCGAATIAVGRAVVEMGLVEKKEPVTTVTLDTPAGIVKVNVDVADGEVLSVRFQSVEAFLYRENLKTDISGYGEITYDLIYGGHFFTYVDIGQFGLEIKPENTQKVCEIGMDILNNVRKEQVTEHPVKAGLGDLDACMFYQAPYEENGKMVYRNTVAFGDHETDRSPCGTGTTARLATLYTRGQLGLGEEFIHESVIGTRFIGKVLSSEDVAGYKFVKTEVKGIAYPWGVNTLIIDSEDPFRDGFLIL